MCFLNEVFTTAKCIVRYGSILIDKWNICDKNFEVFSDWQS